ncbi:MAG: hypothetical protein J3K34DRAFT_126727 [Monoraphidium minutum]|nr:MAG: hypothetical protein J3K34DRAFT_126727 [Monoraphidium minutum]
MPVHHPARRRGARPAAAWSPQTHTAHTALMALTHGTRAALPRGGASGAAHQSPEPPACWLAGSAPKFDLVGGPSDGCRSTSAAPPPPHTTGVVPDIHPCKGPKRASRTTGRRRARAAAHSPARRCAPRRARPRNPECATRAWRTQLSAGSTPVPPPQPARRPRPRPATPPAAGPPPAGAPHFRTFMRATPRALGLFVTDSTPAFLRIAADTRACNTPPASRPLLRASCPRTRASLAKPASRAGRVSGAAAPPADACARRGMQGARRAGAPGGQQGAVASAK